MNRRAFFRASAGVVAALFRRANNARRAVPVGIGSCKRLNGGYQEVWRGEIVYPNPGLSIRFPILRDEVAAKLAAQISKIMAGT
jgi:hypothetical protein